MYIRNPKLVKLKIKLIELVCVCVCELEHINTSLSYTRSKYKLKLNKQKSSCRELFLQADSIQTRSKELDSIRVLDAIWTHELLNLHVLAPKLFC